MNEQENEKGNAAPALSPFDWTEAGHVVVRAGEAVNWDLSDPAGFVKRVQSIEYGLSTETEFAAILSWLGRCSLEQFQFRCGGIRSVENSFGTRIP
jgi:hypothetical protein